MVDKKSHKMIASIKHQMSQLCDGTLAGYESQYVSQLTQFQFDIAEIADNRIEDPFDDAQVVLRGDGLPQEKMLEQQCMMTRCCNTLFNRHNIDKVLDLNNGNMYCVFCGK